MRASPLYSTLAVLAGLGLLAWPLRSMTRPADHPVATPSQAVSRAPEAVSGVLRLRLLAAAESVEVCDQRGAVVWKTGPLEAGEHEAVVRFPIDGPDLDLAVKAVFSSPDAETALFLTVLPDNREDRTAYAIGAGRLQAPLAFHW